MKKSQRSILSTFIVFLIIFTFCVSQSYAFEIEIDVAPNILNFQSDSVFVTVHTDIAYSAVEITTVSLNGVSIEFAKSDDRGYFVAKFLSTKIEKEAEPELKKGEYNTLILTGFTFDVKEFIGSQEIMVIDSELQGPQEPQGPQGKD